MYRPCNGLAPCVHSSDLTKLDSLPGELFGSAGVPTRPAGYTEDGSRATSGIPPAPLTHAHAQLGIPKTAHGTPLEYHQLPHGSSTHSLTGLTLSGCVGCVCAATVRYDPRSDSPNSTALLRIDLQRLPAASTAAPHASPLPHRICVQVTRAEAAQVRDTLRGDGAGRRGEEWRAREAGGIQYAAGKSETPSHNRHLPPGTWLSGGAHPQSS